MWVMIMSETVLCPAETRDWRHLTWCLSFFFWYCLFYSPPSTVPRSTRLSRVENPREGRGAKARRPAIRLLDYWSLSLGSGTVQQDTDTDNDNDNERWRGDNSTQRNATQREDERRRLRRTTPHLSSTVRFGFHASNHPSLPALSNSVHAIYGGTRSFVRCQITAGSRGCIVLVASNLESAGWDHITLHYTTLHSTPSFTVSPPSHLCLHRVVHPTLPSIYRMALDVRPLPSQD
jgi:hypothetical protein